SGTIHTSMYEPQSLTAHITLGENKVPTVIDFSKWLDGESLDITSINGHLDTDLTFATY
ncbi:MAG: acyl-CoA--6-aminopenicillanic acid acyltransferase, partial [Staphylococcus equorum]|nr:acyl-CoA--6-aminopenicillanic acid acyltransferase [Staphylococcus equorum]